MSDDQTSSQTQTAAKENEQTSVSESQPSPFTGLTFLEALGDGSSQLVCGVDGVCKPVPEGPGAEGGSTGTDHSPADRLSDDDTPTVTYSSMHARGAGD